MGYVDGQYYHCCREVQKSVYRQILYAYSKKTLDLLFDILMPSVNQEYLTSISAR